MYARITSCHPHSAVLIGPLRWVAAVASQFGKLDILVNCAAGNFLAAAEELTQNGFKTGESMESLGHFLDCKFAPCCGHTHACTCNVSRCELCERYPLVCERLICRHITCQLSS